MHFAILGNPTAETLGDALAPCRGGMAILTLRALHQSERFERAWKLLSSTYKRTVEIPENVVMDKILSAR